MESRERVRKALKHDPLDRLPIGYMLLLQEVFENLSKATGIKTEEEIIKFFGSDYQKIRTPLKQNPSDDVREYYERTFNKKWPIQDIERPGTWPGGGFFGFESSETLSSAVGKAPFAEVESVKEIEAFPWADPDWLDYDAVSAEADKYSDKCVIINDWIPTFNTTCSFFGMDKALMNFIFEPELIEATIEHITEYIYQKHERELPKLQGKADLIFLGDDVCDQRGVMMGVERWRQFLKKPLQRLIDQIHKYGFDVHMHCCGNIAPILPDFIDMGVVQIEPAQFGIEGMEVEKLQKEYGNHIVFYGGVSTQKTLPHGTPEDVRNEVRYYKDLFKNGGYAVCSCHSLLPEFPVENILALYDEAKK